MNNSIFNFFYSFTHQSQFMDSVIWFFAVPFIYIVLVSFAIYFFIYYKFFNLRKFKNTFSLHGRNLSIIFISAFSSYILSSLAKIIIHTHRPFILWSRVRPLFMETGYAFPSSHSATIAAFAFALFFHKHKKFGYICMGASLLVGVARVMAGVHFPVDILGGYLLGFLVAFIFSKV